MIKYDIINFENHSLIFKSSSDKVADEDIISAVEFDHTGRYLSLGDRAGRLIIFNLPQSKTKKAT